MWNENNINSVLALPPLLHPKLKSQGDEGWLSYLFSFSSGFHSISVVVKIILPKKPFWGIVNFCFAILIASLTLPTKGNPTSVMNSSVRIRRIRRGGPCGSLIRMRNSFGPSPRYSSFLIISIGLSGKASLPPFGFFRDVQLFFFYPLPLHAPPST